MAWPGKAILKSIINHWGRKMKNTAQLTTELINITPAIAKSYLGQNQSNRPLSKRHIQRLSEVMMRKEWITNNDSICFDGSGVLINGQHRLYAIIKSGISVDILVSRGFDPDSFRTMDSLVMARGGRDALALMGVKDCSIISGALTLIHQYKNYNTMSSYCLITPTIILKEYDLHPDISLYAETIPRGQYKGLLSPVVGLYFYYVISKADYNKGNIFMNGLVYGYNLEKHNPMLRLRDKLIKNHSTYPKYSRLDQISLLIYTWNKFMKGEKIINFKQPTQNFPAILGDKLKIS